MDIKNALGHKTQYLSIYNNLYKDKYNYEEDGVLTKCLPKILFKGNSILVTFLQLIDLRIIMCLKYINRLKNFKNIHNYQ